MPEPNLIVLLILVCVVILAFQFDNLLSLVCCRHKSTSFPLTIAGHSTYVCCLSCGRRFEYDMQAMRRGKEIQRGDRKKEIVGKVGKEVAGRHV